MRTSFFSCVAVITLALTSPNVARASPPLTTTEDALADGDIDVEDVATTRSFVRPVKLGSLPSSLVPVRAPVLGPGRWGSASLSLVGFSRRTLDDRQEVGGFLVVGLPLDRFGQGSRSLRTAVASATAPEVERTTDALPLERVSAVEGSLDVVLTPKLARAAVLAAWRASGLPPDDSRLLSIVSRARWSAILPETRLRAVRFEDARLSLDTGTDTSRLRDSAGANVGFEARVTWRFDRLIYADDEPAFERIRFELRDARARVAAKTLDALIHWQRAVLDQSSLTPNQLGTRDEAEAALRVMEAEAALDVLTGGWFGNEKRTLAKKPLTTTSRRSGEL